MVRVPVREAPVLAVTE
jgi:hypothetical protein